MYVYIMYIANQIGVVEEVRDDGEWWGSQKNSEGPPAPKT